MKKILSLLLTAAMLLSCLPAAFAASAGQSSPGLPARSLELSTCVAPNQRGPGQSPRSRRKAALRYQMQTVTLVGSAGTR